MATKDLRGKIAIVGASESNEMGKLPEKSVLTLHAEAANNALEDAGLKKEDVDGLFTAGVTANELCEYIGMVPRYMDSTTVGGCSFIMHVEHAMLALGAGVITTAVITHGESGRSWIGLPIPGDESSTLAGQFEDPFGVNGPTTQFSIPVTRHMHRYGTTRKQLAEVSVATRKWAAMHPKAKMKDPITIDDVFESRMICWPFNLLMCCLVTDAGGAIVLTTVDRARDLKHKPVYILGTGEAVSHDLVSMMSDMTTSECARVSGKAAFEMAGVTHKDIDVAELYDAFAFTPMLALEDLGFVKPGESGPFVEGQRTAPGGEFPMNTNGGGLSYTHSGMYGIFTLIELTRQLRGEAGERQVKDAKIGIAHGPGGMFAAASTLIAGSEIP
ncbi:MAG: thiolase [Chloroflexi bacterium]|nr:thiolase [Chloroflexota bacterium]